MARPASVSYQLQKFARRHKAVVGGAAAVFVVLIGGIVVSASQAARARRAEAIALEQRDKTRSERDRAVSAELAATAARDRAEAEGNKAVQEKKRADTQAATAAAVSVFLQKDLFEQANSPGQTGANSDQSLRGALDHAAAKIQGKYGQNPLVEAGVREAIAQAYIGLLASKEAIPHLERAMEIRRRIQGEEEPDTLDTTYRLGALYLGQKRTTEAEALLKKVYDTRLRMSGEWDPKTMNALFALITAFGNDVAAEPLLAKADAMWEKRAEEGLRGASQDEVRTFLADGISLGMAYDSHHKNGPALLVYNRVHDLSSRLLGKDDLFTVTAGAMRTVLVPALKDGKNISDSVQAKLTELGNTVMGLLFQSAFRANASIADHKFDEAESLLQEGLVVAQRAGSDDALADIIVAGIRETLGWLRLQSGKPADAEVALREAAGVLDRVMPDAKERFNNQSMLGAALEAQKKFAEAEPLLVSGYEGMSSRTPGTSTGRFTLDQAGEAVVRLYQDWGKPKKASEWKARLAAVPQAKLVGK